MLDNIFRILWSIPAVLIAITIHEYAHARIAYYLGDYTAAKMGRLTLNPLAHLDLVGALMLLLFRFGWAKPVPVNFSNLNHPKRDMVYISLAGPAANIIIAIIFSLVLKISNFFLDYLFILHNQILLNLLFTFVRGWFIFLQTGILINLTLALFNLIPFPPLDGSKVLMGLLPDLRFYRYIKLETYGPIILLILVLSGIIGKILFPLVYSIFRLLI